MSRFRDFDAERAEAKGEPVEFVFRGERFTLPPSIPAAVILEVIALRQESGDSAEVPAEAVFGFVRALFGADTERLLAANPTVDELGEIVTWVAGAYSDGGG